MCIHQEYSINPEYPDSSLLTIAMAQKNKIKLGPFCVTQAFQVKQADDGCASCNLVPKLITNYCIEI